MKPSSFKSKSYILGIGNDFILILLSSDLKSKMKQRFLFSLGIINVGAAHFELFSRFKPALLTNLLNSVLRASSYIFGIGNGLAWYG